MTHSQLAICALLLAISLCQGQWALGPLPLPDILATLQHCPENEVASICRECERSCGAGEDWLKCAGSCSPGCMCKLGMVRHEGSCIPQEECHLKGLLENTEIV